MNQSLKELIVICITIVLCALVLRSCVIEITKNKFEAPLEKR